MPRPRRYGITKVSSNDSTTVPDRPTQTLVPESGDNEWWWWDDNTDGTPMHVKEAWKRKGWVVYSDPGDTEQAPTPKALHFKDECQSTLVAAPSVAGSTASSLWLGSECGGVVSTVSRDNGTGSTGGSSLQPLQPLQPPQPVTPPKAQSLSTDLCNHWLHGYCSWGLKCRFVHTGSRASDRKPLLSSGFSLATKDDPESTCEEAGQLVQAEEGSETNYNSKEAKWVWRRPAARFWAHIFLHRRHPAFDIVPILIGRMGNNMRDIFAATNAKLRIRGRGSGHLEVDGKDEAPVPLMLAVTATNHDPEGFRKAIEMVMVRLHAVSAHFCLFCQQHGLHQPTSKEPLFSFGETCRGSQTILADLLELWPHPSGPKGLAKKMPPGSLTTGFAELKSLQDADAASDTGKGAPLDATARPKRVRTRKQCKISSPPAEPAPEAANPHPQEDNHAGAIAHRRDPQHQHLMPPQYQWRYHGGLAHDPQGCGTQFVTWTYPVGYPSGWSLAGHSEALTGYTGWGPTGYQGSGAAYGGDYSYTHLAASSNACDGGDLYMPTAHDGNDCSGAVGYGFGGQPFECPRDSVGNCATCGSCEQGPAAAGVCACDTWLADSNGTEPNSSWGQTECNRPAPAHVVQDLASLSTIWQNQVSSTPTPFGLLGLPSVPRDGVAPFPCLPGVESLEGMPDGTRSVGVTAEAAGDGHSSTDGDDDLGRAVTSKLNDYYKGQGSELVIKLCDSQE